jgi:GNAT superfamily N-acetyltransferase
MGNVSEGGPSAAPTAGPSAAPAVGIDIRAAEPADLAAVATLRWHWVLENGGAPVVTRDEFVEFFVDWAARADESHHCTVARRGQTVVGMAWLAVVPRVPSPQAPVRASGDVQCVYVMPAERDSGVGARMLDAVLRQAFDLGLERVTVHSSPGAITAYERAGFELSDRLLQATPSTTSA